VDSKKVVIDFSKPLVNKIFEYDIGILSIDELSRLPIDNYSEKQKQIIEKVLKSKLND
jgi:protoporphyrinogen oxidase